MKKEEVSPMAANDAILLLLLGGVGYLIWRVTRLERLLTPGSGRKRPGVRTTGDGKIIPILRDDIEPGPFKPERKRPETTRKDDE
jgi:hypothetical protein